MTVDRLLVLPQFLILFCEVLLKDVCHSKLESFDLECMLAMVDELQSRSQGDSEQ